jgi:hypothetical protein
MATINQVCRAMAKYIDDEGVQYRGLLRINTEIDRTNVVSNNPRGFIDTVLNAMNAHIGNLGIEIWCFAILKRWVLQPSAMRVLVWQHGGASSVIRVMLSRPQQRCSILRVGCEILACLSDGRPHVSQDIALEGGVRAVVYAAPFIPHRDQEEERALAGFATTDIGVGAIVAQGGLHLLISKLQMWITGWECTDLDQWTCEQMHAYRDIDTSFNLEITCNVLARVARTPLGMDAIVKEGGIRLVLDVMRLCVLTHTRIAYDGSSVTMSQETKNGLQTTLCDLLVMFSDHEDAIMCVIDNGGVAVLLDVQKDSHGDGGIEFAVSRILRGVHDVKARIIQKNMAFAYAMYRRGPASDITPDIMRKIQRFAAPGTGVR